MLYTRLVFWNHSENGQFVVEYHQYSTKSNLHHLPWMPLKKANGRSDSEIGSFFYLRMQRRLMQTKVYHKRFYSIWKEASHKLLKVAAVKKYSSSVYIVNSNCFDKCFLFHVITRKHYFLYKFVVTQRFSTIAMLLRSLRQVFWKKPAL